MLTGRNRLSPPGMRRQALAGAELVRRDHRRQDADAAGVVTGGDVGAQQHRLVHVDLEVQRGEAEIVAEFLLPAVQVRHHRVVHVVLIHLVDVDPAHELGAELVRRHPPEAGDLRHRELALLEEGEIGGGQLQRLRLHPLLEDDGVAGVIDPLRDVVELLLEPLGRRPRSAAS